MEEIADIAPVDAPPSPAARPAAPTPDAFAAGDFQVALSIEIERADVPIARLQALQQGAVLPLPDSDGRLAVRIAAGGRTIATGQIVSIGQGYGVLIDALHREG